MTTLSEMQELVVAQTRRPEISSITDAAIRTATLRAHHTDFFPRDLASYQLSYAPSSSVFYDFTNVSNTIARLRSFKHIQSTDAVTGSPTEQLEYRDADDLYDSDGNRRGSVYTLLGDTLRIYPSSVTGVATAFYYANPNLAGLQYSSWIADTYPDEVAMWAAAIVFARTGFAELANQMSEQHIKPFKDLLVSSHLLGTVS